MKKCTHLIQEFLDRGSRCPDCIADDEYEKNRKKNKIKNKNIIK